jgi:hypothetical protein
VILRRFPKTDEYRRRPPECGRVRGDTRWP